jgi:hypothetical protein
MERLAFFIFPPTRTATLFRQILDVSVPTSKAECRLAAPRPFEYLTKLFEATSFRIAVISHQRFTCARNNANIYSFLLSVFLGSMIK